MLNALTTANYFDTLAAANDFVTLAVSNEFNLPVVIDAFDSLITKQFRRLRVKHKFLFEKYYISSKSIYFIGNSS